MLGRSPSRPQRRDRDSRPETPLPASNRLDTHKTGKSTNKPTNTRLCSHPQTDHQLAPHVSTNRCQLNERQPGVTPVTWKEEAHGGSPLLDSVLERELWLKQASQRCDLVVGVVIYFTLHSSPESVRREPSGLDVRKKKNQRDKKNQESRKMRLTNGQRCKSLDAGG